MSLLQGLVNLFVVNQLLTTRFTVRYYSFVDLMCQINDELEDLHTECTNSALLASCIERLKTTIGKAKNLSIPQDELETFINLTKSLENKLKVKDVYKFIAYKHVDSKVNVEFITW